jgi:iron complex outermembrane receptor protein
MLDQVTNEVIETGDVNLHVEQAIKWVSTYRIQKGKLNAEVSGYLNYIFNYIYLRPAGVTKNTRGVFPYFRYTQTDASFLGVDFSLSYSLSSKLNLGSKISLLRASDETNNDYLIFIPSSRYEVSMRYDVPNLTSWTSPYLEMRFKYVSKQNRAPRVVPMRDIIDAKEQGIDLFENDNRNFDFVDSPDGYFLASLSAGISRPIQKSKLDLRVSVENLTNTAYREYSNRMRYYADDIGRNISIALRYSF